METLFDVAPLAAVNGCEVGASDRRGVGSSRYGALAEQLAIVELLRRGHAVAVPVVDDDGVDLVVDYRVRVQVKNARRRMLETVPGYVYDGFSWSSKRRWVEADVFLLHGDGEWWVVPACALAAHGKTLISYRGAGRGMAERLEQYRGAWDVFDGV